MVCHGSGDLIQVTIDTIQSWRRDYSYEGSYGYSSDLADSLRSRKRVAAEDLSDAAGLMDFGWADDKRDIVTLELNS